MGPEMGHGRLTDDWEGAGAVASKILDLAREFVFPGEPEWLRDLPEHTIASCSFDAHFRLQEDRLDAEGENARTMLLVRFDPRQPDNVVLPRLATVEQVLPDDPWAIWVRGAWLERRDRLADTSFFSSKRLRTGDQRPRKTEPPSVPWGRHDNLWICAAAAGAEKIQHDDVRAQVALFLIQTSLVQATGAVRDGLSAYLLDSFKWRGIDDAPAVALELCEHLRRHKWLLDDWRGWRKYVRACIDGLIKQVRHRAAVEPDLTPDRQGNLTVDQFAWFCQLPRSTAYALVRAGKVRSVSSPVTARSHRGLARCRISLEEAQQIQRTPRRRDIIALVALSGRSSEAARKWVYRQERRGRSLAEIAAEIREQIDRLHLPIHERP